MSDGVEDRLNRKKQSWKDQSLDEKQKEIAHDFS